jgi:hypothetical protein
MLQTEEEGNLDISSTIDITYGGSKFWALLVDDYTDHSGSI